MITAKIRKTLEPHQITAIIDTREQTPLDLSPLQQIRGTLDTADYSVMGLEHIIAVERKNLQDLVQCVGRERERFEREMIRLAAYPVKALVIEAGWAEIELKTYRGQVHPNAVMGSLMGWLAQGVPILMAGDHRNAGLLVSRLLFTAARRRYQECFTFFEKTVNS